MDDLRISSRVTLPSQDLSWSASRSSGPGGQNVNRVASKVDLRFDLDGTRALSPAVKARLRALAGNQLDKEGQVMITSQATREQARNLEDARDKLASLVRRALQPPKRRKKTRPSRRAKQRRLDAKKRRSEKKKYRGRVDY
jgi:ribosome-associated protein